MDLPSFDALLALEAVVRLGSVTRAAATLHVTQSAVSHRLHGLEQALGVPLVLRSGRGLAFTDAARELARATELAAEQLAEALGRVRSRHEHDALSIGCSPSFAIRFLVPRVAVFRRAHPALDLHVAAADVPADAVRGAAALIHLSRGPTPGLHAEKLAHERVYPVMSPHLLPKKRRTFGEAELARCTLLHDDALAHERGRIDWAAWLRFAGFRRLLSRPSSTRGTRFSHAYLAIEAAIAGDGVALARHTLVADELARGGLVAPFSAAMPSGLAYWFVSAQDPARTPAVAALRDFLRAELAAAAGQPGER